MKKLDYLLRLRNVKTLDTLDKIIEKKGYEAMHIADYMAFISAADHRLAEIVMGRLYDRVPKAVWGFIR